MPHTINQLITMQNNVLVDSENRARLADFGISSTSSVTHTKALAERGTWEYKAPELAFVAQMPTNESDFFSLAHLIWEVCALTRGLARKQRDTHRSSQMFSLVPPYGHVTRSYYIPAAIKNGERPPRPEGCESVGLTDELWTLIEQCWSDQPRHRRQAWDKMIEMFEVQSVIDEVQFSLIV
jgi:serine/threonine protein kinase